jgi:hypothetical protein
VPPVDGQFIRSNALGHGCTIRLTPWTEFLYGIFDSYVTKEVKWPMATRTY